MKQITVQENIMKNYTVYHVIETEFLDCFGAKYGIKETDYSTNDSGCGLFSGDCIHQITGNGQFYASSAREIANYFDDKDNGPRCFPTKIGATRYINRMNRENPLRKIPIPEYKIGQAVTLINSMDSAVIISQSGDEMTVTGPVERQSWETGEMETVDEKRTVKYYDIF